VSDIYIVSAPSHISRTYPALPAKGPCAPSHARTGDGRARNRISNVRSHSRARAPSPARSNFVP
jgi:hypothetical protein